MKKKWFDCWCRNHQLRKMLFVMKLTFVGVLFFCMQISAAVYSQNQKLSLHMKNATIQKVLNEIESQSNYRFVLRKEHVNTTRKVNVSLSDKSIEDVLGSIFEGTAIKYIVTDKNLVIIRKGNGVGTQKERKITGVVTDTKGESLPGVSVVVKGTTIGVTTDIDGKYSLLVPANSESLQFSFVGMKTQERTIGGNSVIDVVLVQDAIGLEEVIAVGYGVIKKSDLTGAVVSVSGEDLAKRNVTNVSQALQGAVAGVMVTRSSGAPGAGNTIRIRGITTLEGVSDPLILVDDVPVGSLNEVNPEDIESYTVLKDGASSAIYGSRAAAGVIIITTKRAKKGYFAIDYSGSYSINKPTRTLDFVSPIRYMEMWNEKVWNDAGNGADQYPVYAKDHIDNYLTNNANDPDNYPITNYKALLVKESAFTNRHNLSISGGSDKIRSKASFGYEHQDALYKIKDWKRYTLRINNDINVSEKWGGSFDLSYRMIDTTDPIVYPLGDRIRESPLYPAVWADGRPGTGRDMGNSYANLLNGGDSKSRSQQIRGKLGLYYKPFEGLKISANFTPSYSNYYKKTFKKTVYLYGADDHDNSDPLGTSHGFDKTNLYEYRNVSESRTSQLLANYDGSWGNHKVAAKAGYEEYYSKYENLSVRGLELPMTDFPYLSHVPTDKVFNNGVGVEEKAYRSLFGQVNYSYNKKYLIQANIRRDGSSKFASEYRWGNFPSLSVGWVISEESWAQALKDKVSFLKLRGSYGSLGNDRLGNYLYISELALGTGVFQHTNGNVISDRSSALQYLVMRDITWETTTSANLALDLTTMNDRLSVSVDVYRKKTTDMLLNLSVPSLIGFDNPKTNVGDMTTKGWEVESKWRDKVGDFKYSVAFNISNSKSVVGDINGKRIFSGATITEEGLEYRTLYGYKTDGLFQSQEDVDNSPVVNSNVKPGDVKFLDISGPDGEPDGKITSDDKTYLGGSLPKFIYGGNLFAEYKGFDLSLAFQGIGKQNRVMSTSAVDGFASNLLQPTTLYDGSYWSHLNSEEENQSAKYPRLTAKAQGINNRFSDYWVFNGAYLRMKNITLGYTLPKSITDRLGVNKLRVYVAGNDLFTVDNFPAGMDPEYSMGNYFITKSYIFGVKLNF
ncbi:SusC/RagA family TonB-linked outer membrane protein [Prolixibacteraceae bacterium JC049]|nr:SusC/RagA family TonB-linked outer membrane protein [Prolixibacteraceae bacterium JC049]